MTRAHTLGNFTCELLMAATLALFCPPTIGQPTSEKDHQFLLPTEAENSNSFQEKLEDQA